KLRGRVPGELALLAPCGGRGGSGERRAEREPPLDVRELVGPRPEVPIELSADERGRFFERSTPGMRAGREIRPAEDDVGEPHRHLLANGVHDLGAQRRRAVQTLAADRGFICKPRYLA